MKLLLYCNKQPPYLEFKQIPRTLMEIDNSFEGYRCSSRRTEADENFQLNGKIVAECDFEVEEIRLTKGLYLDEDYITNTFREKEILKYSCLSFEELDNYLKGEKGYAIHIKNLHIFDKPKELSEYCKYSYPNFDKGNIVEKAPQNMCKVLTKNGYSYILISIRPEWLCKILNGEKTIEVRKKVLRGMLDE